MVRLSLLYETCIEDSFFPEGNFGCTLVSAKNSYRFDITHSDASKERTFFLW